MTGNNAPYVGVSGVVGVGQQLALEREHVLSGLAAHRLLLLGAKATHKTQWLDVPNKYGAAWFPVGERAFSRALNDTGAGTLRVAQVYLEEAFVSDSGYRDAFTERLLARGARWLNGVQFDMLPWHTADWAGRYLRDLRSSGLTVLVQCHSPAMSELGSRVREAASASADGIDHVLFDASHGRGLGMNPAVLAEFLEAAATQDGLAGCGLAVAGGLDPGAVHGQLPEPPGSYPSLSWDAEGKLHPFADGSRPLSLTEATGYLLAKAGTPRSGLEARLAPARSAAEPGAPAAVISDRNTQCVRPAKPVLRRLELARPAGPFTAVGVFGLNTHVLTVIAGPRRRRVRRRRIRDGRRQSPDGMSSAQMCGNWAWPVIPAARVEVPG